MPRELNALFAVVAYPPHEVFPEVFRLFSGDLLYSAIADIFRRTLYVTPLAARSTLTWSRTSWLFAAIFHFNTRKIPSGAEGIIAHF